MKRASFRSVIAAVAFGFVAPAFCVQAFAAQGDEVSEKVKKQVASDLGRYFQSFVAGDYAKLKQSVSARYLKENGPEASLRSVLAKTKGDSQAGAYVVEKVLEGANKNEVFVTIAKAGETAPEGEGARRLLRAVKQKGRYVVDELRGNDGH